MYAIVNVGSREFRVQEGDKIEIDFLKAAEKGSSVTLDDVRLISTGKEIRVGNPNVKGASISAKVLGLAKGNKIRVQRFKRRKTMKNAQRS